MKKMLVLATALVLLALVCTPALAAIVLTETVDHATWGTNYYYLPDGDRHGWNKWGTTQTELDYEPNPAWNKAGTDSGSFHQGVGSDRNWEWFNGITGEFNASVWIYDSGGTAAGHSTGTTDVRCNASFMELRGYSNQNVTSGTPSGTLGQLFAFGLYDIANTGDFSLYSYRVLYGSTTGWKRLSGITPTVGWHKFGITRDAAGTVNFYVDDTLGATVTGATAYTMNMVSLGGPTSGGAGYGSAYYDGLYIANTVPEPGSMLAFVTGLVGLAGLRLRRKK